MSVILFSETILFNLGFCTNSVAPEVEHEDKDVGKNCMYALY